jgi:predicted NACHT family NTPase
MGPDDVGGFVDHWHSAFAKKQATQGQPIDLTEKAAKLKRTIRRESALAQLATNPLMCGMICALNDYRQDYLPKNLPDLCRALCEMFLHRRDEERGLATNLVDQEYHKLDARQKRAVLKQLAVFFMDEDRSSVEEPAAVKLVANELRLFPGCNPDRAEAVLRGLIERSGMLRQAKPAEEGKPSKIEFIHNTFKEYLAGEWYATAERVNRLLGKLDSQSWRRVTLFAVGTDQDLLC